MHIDATSFGSITIDGATHEHDVVIRLSGKVVKRKKKLSKKRYGTSHTISEDEVRFVFERGCETMVVGTGQMGVARLSEEAGEFLKRKGCAVVARPTPEAVEAFNKLKSPKTGLFHVTC